MINSVTLKSTANLGTTYSDDVVLVGEGWMQNTARNTESETDLNSFNLCYCFSVKCGKLLLHLVDDAQLALSNLINTKKYLYLAFRILV
jgi:hypothetical protein